MGDHEHSKRPVEVEGAPVEEDFNTADMAERVDLDPDEQPNRTERSIAEAERPEDR